MSLGTILIGIAITMIVIAYVARPLRRSTNDPDAAIEAWVTKRSMTPTRSDMPTSPHPAAPAPLRLHEPAPLRDDIDTQVNFCPQCGRRVQPDHRFCPGCGYRLPREDAEA